MKNRITFVLMLMIGIDPGTVTGVAIWDVDEKTLVDVNSFSILQAIYYVGLMAKHAEVCLYVEDPNTWIPFGNRRGTAARLQGAGSIKRDFAIWMEFATERNIKVIRTRLQGTLKKLPAAQFKLITGWQDGTNEHGRDAAMLVFGRHAEPGETHRRVKR